MKGKKKTKKQHRSNIFFDTIALIKKSGINFILFEMVYKLGAIAVFYPLFLFGFEFTLKRAGFKYLTNDYVYLYFRNPFTILFLIIIFFLAVTYVTIDICCIAVCYDAAYHNRKISLLEIFRGGFSLYKKRFSGKKFFSGLSMVLILVLSNVSAVVYLFSGFNIPSFVTSFIAENSIIKAVLIILSVGIVLYCIVNIFVVNFAAYDGEKTKTARKKSRSMMKHRWAKTILAVIVWNILVMAVIYIVNFVLLGLIWAGVTVLNKIQLGIAIYLAVFKNALSVIKILLLITVLPFCFAMITSMFYRFRGDTGSVFNTSVFAEEGTHRSRKSNLTVQRTVAAILTVMFTGINIFYIVRGFDKNPFHNVEMFSDTMVMAHRGNSYNAPENTMLAFEKAVLATADYIELDVHETKDGEIVVMHDSNLKRTTGINKYIWDVTYEEIKDVDAGSWFGSDEEFKNCRIPTLKEVLKFAKGRIKLNIEIKLSDNEPGLVKKVVALIEEFKVRNDCVVTSMNYEALKEVKNLDKDIKTGYVLSVAFGSFYNIDNVDAFSINSGYVEKGVVDAIHNRGKEIYVWTINGENRAEELTMMGVDAIITDNSEMARDVTYKRYSKGLMFNVLSYVFKR